MNGSGISARSPTKIKSISSQFKPIQVNSLIQWQPTNTFANQFIGMALCFGLCFHLRTEVLCRRVEPLRCPPQPRMLRRFCAWDLESLHEFKLIQVNPSQSSSQLHIRFVRLFSQSRLFCVPFHSMLVPFLLFLLFFSLRMFEYYLFHHIFTSDFDQTNNCCFIFELGTFFLF